MQGIRLIRQEESYSSQCPPQSEEVSRIYAEKKNRKKRCIYIVDTVIYNADAVGAYNILRKYHAVSGEEIDMPVTAEESRNNKSSCVTHSGSSKGVMDAPLKLRSYAS